MFYSRRSDHQSTYPHCKTWAFSEERALTYLQHCRLGHCYYLSRICDKLLWPCSLPLVSRSLRGWPVSWLPVLSLVLGKNLFHCAVTLLSLRRDLADNTDSTDFYQYRRQEFGFRSSLFFASAAIAGSFGGLLAAAIGKMQGMRGKSGWQWIFIIEGLATVVIGLVSFFMVHDFPDQPNRFLSDSDRQRVIERLKDDGQASAAHENFQWRVVRASLCDWKTYTSSVIYMGLGGALYGFSLFLPTSESPSQPLSFFTY
jgi:MFS family permease